MKKFKVEMGNLTLRSCGAHLMQDGEHYRAKIVKWFSDEKDKCYTIGYYNEASEGEYDFMFVGERPFDSDVDPKTFMSMVKYGYEMLGEK
jgi:hypothetical protein